MNLLGRQGRRKMLTDPLNVKQPMSVSIFALSRLQILQLFLRGELLLMTQITANATQFFIECDWTLEKLLHIEISHVHTSVYYLSMNWAIIV